MIQDGGQQVKNSIIYLIPVLTSSLIPFITLPIFTRILTKEDYGALALAQVYAIFTSGICNIGLTNVYNRNFFKYKDIKRAAELLYSIVFFVIATTSTCAIFTYFVKAPLSKFIIGNSLHSNLLFIAFCSVGLSNLKTYYLNYFRNSENATKFVSYTICESILNFIISIFFVVYIKIGVIGILLGQLFAGIIVFFSLSITLIRFLPIRFNWSILKESLSISYPLTLKVFFGIIGNQFDKYMIGLLATVGGVGLYSIGQRIAYFAFTYMTALQNVFSPQVFKRMFDLGKSGGKSVGEYLTPFVYISIAIALVLSLYAEELIIILTPPSYHGAIDIVIILTMFYGSLFFGKQPQLLYAKKTYISSLLSFFTIILNVSLNIPFIIFWGAIGAAWATFIAGVVSGAISFFIAQHYYKILWEYKKVCLIYFIFFFSSILMVVLRYYYVEYETRLLIKCIAVSLYIYLGTHMRIITIENIVMIKNSFMPKRASS